MGVLIVFLFVCVAQTIVASDVQTATQPELVTSSLKYTAQEYHLPSHALYTITSKVPTVHMDTPTVRHFTGPELNPVIPVFQETDRLRLPSPKVLKEIRINKPSRKCTGQEEKPAPPKVLRENIYKDIKMSTEYYPGQTKPNRIETISVPLIHPNQNDKIDHQNVLKNSEHEEYAIANKKDNPNPVNILRPTQQDCSEKVLLPPYIVPYITNVTPTEEIFKNNIPCKQTKNYESPTNLNAPVDAMSYLQPSRTKHEPMNKAIDNRQETPTINKLPAPYDGAKQRDPINKSEFNYRPVPDINTNVNCYHEQPKAICPSGNILKNVDSIRQQQQSLPPHKTNEVPLRDAVMIKEPFIITEKSFYDSDNNLPRYKSVSSNIIDCNTPDEDVKTHMKNIPSNLYVKEKTNMREERKGHFDYSKLKNENDNIQKQIERIKQKYTNINASVQTKPNKLQNLDTEIIQTQYLPNNILSKSEKLECNKIANMMDGSVKNSKLNIDNKELNNYLKDIPYNSIIRGPPACKNTLEFNNERTSPNFQSLQSVCPSKDFQTHNDQEQVKNQFITTAVPVEVNKKYNSNLGSLQYCDVNKLFKEIPVSTQEVESSKNIVSGNKKVVISNGTTFNNCVPISYDVSTLNTEINEILQSKKIKQIIDDAVRNSLAHYEMDGKVIRPSSDTQFCIGNMYKPSFNQMDLEVDKNPLRNNLQVIVPTDEKKVLEKGMIHASHAIPCNTLGYIKQDCHQDISQITRLNISPSPIKPMVITPPGSISNKIVEDQPQGYKKVSSSSYTSPERIINPHCNSITSGADIVRNCIIYPKYTPIDSSLNYPSYTPETVPCLPSLECQAPCHLLHQVNNGPTLQYAISSKDKYASLVSSSLNNISSVILTNLLSAMNSNIANNVTSTKSFTSPSEIPLELATVSSTLLPLNESPSLVPTFEVTPPCVESPRYLPELSNSLYNSTSEEKPLSSKSSKKSKGSKNQSVSTITINVLPSVQQNSNDIIILV